MKLGCVTYQLLQDWDLDTIIKNLEANGYEAVELRTEHKHGVEPTISKEQRSAVTAKFGASKVRLLSFGSTAAFHDPSEAVRLKNVEDAKKFIELAHDTGAWGVKVRPNTVPEGQSIEATVGRIAECLRELGNYGAGYGVEIWLEVHGKITQNPPVCAAIMQATKHPQVGLCWNSNPTDVVNGSVRQSFDILKPWIRNVHLDELAGPYPYRELFRLLRDMKYERYTLCEAKVSKEPERLLRWYAAMWRELQRP